VNEVIVRYENLPHFIKGKVLPDPAGDYNVYINAQLTYEMQQKTIEHELRHIAGNDFDNGKTIEQTEDFF